MENTQIVIDAITLISTLLASFAGSVASASITRYRIKSLEKKVDENNKYTHRIPVLEEKIETSQTRISNLENRNHNYAYCGFKKYDTIKGGGKIEN